MDCGGRHCRQRLSDGFDTLERMFDESGPRSRREVIARFDALAEQMLERWRQRTPTTESADWLDQMATAVRIENQAVAAQLAAIGGLFRYRLAQCSRDRGLGRGHHGRRGRRGGRAACGSARGWPPTRCTMPARCANGSPRRPRSFIAGDIDYRAFSTIVSRTDLIVEPDALARVDELVAVNVARWPSLTRGRLAAQSRCDRGPRGRRCGAPPQRTPR